MLFLYHFHGLLTCYPGPPARRRGQANHHEPREIELPETVHRLHEAGGLFSAEGIQPARAENRKMREKCLVPGA